MDTLSSELIRWLNSAVGNKDAKLKKRIKSFCNKYADSEVFDSSTCTLKSDIAQELGIALCGDFDLKPNTCLYRYVSLNSLVRTLNDGKQSMCSLVAMNDKTEKDFFHDYIRQYTKYASYKNIIEDNLKTLNNDTHYYITSLMTKENRDDLNMWRIYGDDAKGVMLEYGIPEIQLPESFFLAYVSYTNKKSKNGSIQFIFQLMSHLFSNGQHIHFTHLDAWQHMFKPHEYHKEKEVRLLYVSKNVDKWVRNEEFNILMPLKLFDIKDYPLKLKSIMLGPKFAEKEINTEMLKLMLKKNGLTDVDIIESTIYSYR